MAGLYRITLGKPVTTFRQKFAEDFADGTFRGKSECTGKDWRAGFRGALEHSA